MLKESAVILDIGSSEVTALIGERGVNNTFLVRVSCEIPYDGFAEGEFFDEQNFKQAVREAIGYISNGFRKNVKKLYVGVPGAFTRIEDRKYKIAFNKKKKINSKDINELFDYGGEMINIPNYKIINRSAIYYALDNNRKIRSPEGKYSSMLGGYLSYALLDNYFSEKTGDILNSLGIRDTIYVSESIAEVKYLLKKEERENFVILCDIGYITTTVSVILGDGVLSSESYDFGGGYISAALMKKFGAEFTYAEELKKKINLSCGDATSAVYKVEIKSEVKEYPAGETNLTATEALDTLAESLDKFITQSKFNITDSTKLYITGGGVSYMRGAAEHLAGRLGLSTEIIAPDIPDCGKPEKSSVYSLLNYALKENKNE